MKAYLLWSLRQVYLSFFWPTRIVRDAEGRGEGGPVIGGRFGYFVGMLPWMAVATLSGNVVVGLVCEWKGMRYDWSWSWVGLWIGACFGLFFAALFGAVLGVLGGVASGTSVLTACLGACVVPFGVGLGATAGVAKGAGGGAAYDLPLNIALGAALGLTLGAAVAVAIGGGSRIVFAVVLGLLTIPVLGSTAFGVPFGLLYFRLAEYPLQVVLAAAAYFVARRRPSVARKAWQWCPVAWSELTWLPLPYVSKLLLLLVRQDREEGFRRIAFVVAERPFQRRVAQEALVEVAFDDLRVNSLGELARVPDKLSWTLSAPTELPTELALALPSFARVAEHVEQYLSLNNAFRKSQALRSAADEVESSQLKNIIAGRGEFAPLILRAANEWRELIERERESVRGLDDAAREIPNPFVFGSPVMETANNVFAGRRDIATQIEAILLGSTQPPTLLLQGPRRMGKTSILNQLPRLLGPDFASAVIDCQNPAVTESEVTLLRYLSRAASAGLRRRRVVVEPLAAAQLAREPYTAFDDWLDRAERAMPQSMRILLCLDEYERLQMTLQAGWGLRFLDWLRHIIQHRPRVVLMVAGAHDFHELGPNWTFRFISARCMRVSFLTRADVELLLTEPIPEFDMTYAPGALEALVAATSCHPFLTQAVAFELVQLLNEQQRREALPADVEAAVALALERAAPYFANVWGDAGPHGQAILNARAAGRTPPDFPAARAWLREHDVIGADGDFAVEMMRRWVAAKAALTS